MNNGFAIQTLFKQECQTFDASSLSGVMPCLLTQSHIIVKIIHFGFRLSVKQKKRLFGDIILISFRYFPADLQTKEVTEHLQDPRWKRHKLKHMFGSCVQATVPAHHHTLLCSL